MLTLSLNDFFNKINYDWKKDEDNIKTICHYTKTRVNPNKNEISLDWGTEQTFLIKALAEWIKAKNFFEIGTGRGTACYAVALIKFINDIHTVDILQFNQKFSTAIGYKPANVSLKDIRKMIPFKEKTKVHFHHRKEFPNIRKDMKNKFDLCFIDGDHSNKNIIIEDYNVCKDVLKPGGIILWDDYDPNRFAVKDIVDTLLKNNNNLDAVLIEQRGHLFTEKPAEKDIGVVIMKNGDLGL